MRTERVVAASRGEGGSLADRQVKIDKKQGQANFTKPISAASWGWVFLWASK
jgi:hypothetical protein